MRALRRVALVLVAIAVVVMAYVSILRLSSDGTPPRGSIILISLDTLRADMLGAYGYEEYPTSPFLDSFAAESVLFENAIVTEPRTLTSHMSLFTGLDPQHHKVQDETTLPEGIPTLAALLKELGFTTQAFVDDGWLERRWGFDRGFDGYVDDSKRGLEASIDLATDWLESNRDRRFFLFLHTYEVHSTGGRPYYRSPRPFRGLFSQGIEADLASNDSKEFKAKWEARGKTLSEDDKRYIRASYAEGIRYCDELLESFFEYLKQARLYDSSTIIVWSDHGEALFEQEDLWGHANVFNQTITVPLLMKLPEHDAAGKRVRSVVSTVDLAPTILDLAGDPGSVDMDGKSVLDLLSNDNGEGVAYTIRTRRKHRLFSVRSRKHHYIWNGRQDQHFFFDVEDDPLAQNNLYPSGLPEESRLQDQLFKWIVEYDRAREGTARPDGAVTIDDEVRTRLKALGYLQ